MITIPVNQNPFQLLHQHPPVATINSLKSFATKSIKRTLTTYTRNAKIWVHQEKVDTTTRDRLAILVTKSQQIDEAL